MDPEVLGWNARVTRFCDFVLLMGGDLIAADQKKRLEDIKADPPLAKPIGKQLEPYAWYLAEEGTQGNDVTRLLVNTIAPGLDLSAQDEKDVDKMRRYMYWLATTGVE